MFCSCAYGDRNKRFQYYMKNIRLTFSPTDCLAGSGKKNAETQRVCLYESHGNAGACMKTGVKLLTCDTVWATMHRVWLHGCSHTGGRDSREGAHDGLPRHTIDSKKKIRK